jgi:hypothetical protein
VYLPTDVSHSWIEFNAEVLFENANGIIIGTYRGSCASMCVVFTALQKRGCLRPAVWREQEEHPKKQEKTISHTNKNNSKNFILLNALAGSV